MSPIEITFVSVTNQDGTAETAAYKRDENRRDWDLVSVEKGDSIRDHAAYKMIEALGVGFRTTNLIVHLRVGGVWQQGVPDHLMQESTPVQQVETTIANLHAEAKRRSDSAGYSGSHHDGGAGIFRERAQGMQDALDILTADND